MDCIDFLEQVEELALNGPDIDLTPELHQHQLACPSCDAQLRDYRKAWLLLPAALETQPIPPELEAGLMDRIAAPQVDRPPFMTSNAWSYALAASVLIALIVSTMFSPAWFGAEAKDVERIRELARQMDRLEELEGAFAAPELRYVSLRSVGTTPSIRGYLVYDLLANEAHFFGFDLPNSGAGSCWVWLLDDARRAVVSAKIDVDSKRLGAAIVKLPENFSSIRETLVTQESESTPASPSQQVQMRTTIEF